VNLRIIKIVGSLSIGWFGSAQFANCQDKVSSKPAVKTNEEKVYDALAEMIVRRDKLMDKFATVFHGESTNIGAPENPITSRPIVLARVVDRSRDFDLRADYVVIDDDFESGTELLRVKGKYKAKSDENLLKRPHFLRPKNQELAIWLKEFPVSGVDPYDDYLIGASAFSFAHNPGLIEQIALERWNLVGVEEGPGGVLTSKWEDDFAGTKFRIRVDFSPAVEMMPVRVSIEGSPPKGFFMETRIEWHRRGVSLSPYRISLSSNSVSHINEVRERHFRCYWLIGDKVPDKIFKAEDHLAALLDEFKITHTQVVNGEVIHVPHELPEDLYDTTK
jgi:hypothetical protein